MQPAGIEDILEGAVRPDRTSGVATVVLKLFNMVQPRGGVPVEGLSAVSGVADDGAATGTASRAFWNRDGARGGWPGAVVAQSISPAEPPKHHSIASTAECAAAVLLAPFLEQPSRRMIGRNSNHGWRPDYASPCAVALTCYAKDDRRLVVLGAARLGTPRLLDNPIDNLSAPSGDAGLTFAKYEIARSVDFWTKVDKPHFVNTALVKWRFWQS